MDMYDCEEDENSKVVRKKLVPKIRLEKNYSAVESLTDRVSRNVQKIEKG